MSDKLIVILGPTAVGKTKLGVQLAYRFNGEIISADSRQVYRGMDIGTGKDLDEYKINNTSVPYHLIDVIEPTDEFNLFQFQKMFYSAFNKITEAGKIPFLVGGTGLYIHSILKGYELQKVDFAGERFEELSRLSIVELQNILHGTADNLHNTSDLLEKERIIKAIIISEADKKKSSHIKDIPYLVIGVRESRDIIKKRITARLKHRLKNGMIEEVKELVANGISFQKLEFFGLEYRFIGNYLKGELTYNDMFQKLNSSIHKFAKRQMTWFRKMEKEGVKINWIEYEEHEKAESIIGEFLSE